MVDTESHKRPRLPKILFFSFTISSHRQHTSVYQTSNRLQYIFFDNTPPNTK